MKKEKSVLTKIGDAMGAAVGMAQEMGASLMKQTEGAASDAKRAAVKARASVEKEARGRRDATGTLAGIARCLPTWPPLAAQVPLRYGVDQ
jgi:hypothetical protein